MPATPTTFDSYVMGACQTEDPDTADHITLRSGSTFYVFLLTDLRYQTTIHPHPVVVVTPTLVYIDYNGDKIADAVWPTEERKENLCMVLNQARTARTKI